MNKKMQSNLLLLFNSNYLGSAFVAKRLARF